MSKLFTGRELEPKGKVNVYVSKLRKDNKHLVTWCYMAKKCRTLETPQAVADIDTSSHNIIRKR